MYLHLLPYIFIGVYVSVILDSRRFIYTYMVILLFSYIIRCVVYMFILLYTDVNTPIYNRPPRCSRIEVCWCKRNVCLYKIGIERRWTKREFRWKY